MTEANEKHARWTPLWLLLTTIVVAIYVGDWFVTVPPSTWGGPRNALTILVGVAFFAFVGLLMSAAICGPRSALSGLRVLSGRAREAELPAAARALGTAGTCAMNLGLLVASLALLAHLDGLRAVLDAYRDHGEADELNPAEWAALFRLGILLGIPASFCAGRLVLGAAGEAAAHRAGLAPPRFSATVQFAAVLIVPLFVLTLYLHFPTLGD